MTQKRLLAIYAYVDDVCRAVARMKAEKITVQTVYSPARNDEVNDALGIGPSPVRRFVLFGAVFGILFGFGLSVYTAAEWKFIVWGKPPIPRVPYVVESFEIGILLAVLCGILGLFILARLPRYRTPAFFDPRFTVDRFGLLLSCPADRVDAVKHLLQETGAEEIRNAEP